MEIINIVCSVFATIISTIKLVITCLINKTSKEIKPFSITMYAYECKLISGKLELTEHTEKQWVKDADLAKVNFAAADLPIVKLINK